MLLTEVDSSGSGVPHEARQRLQALVVNFNGPELGFLALRLAKHQHLLGYVRSYVNKGRIWERALERLPFVADAHRRTFGRRRISDVDLLRLTRDAGIMSDVCAAGFGRANQLPNQFRNFWMLYFQERVRRAVSKQAARSAINANCVVAYSGFGLPAFRANSGDATRKVLNYPIAHHRHQRKMRQEESELEPEFASTWSGFDHWPADFEGQLDEELEIADGVLVGSTYARDSFVREGIPESKIKVIPYGVDLDTFWSCDEHGPRENFEVVYVGQLSQRKGISYLLRGYQAFQRRDSRLTIIGSPVEGMTPFLPYRDVFRHVPHMTRPALAGMYRQSDVFVFPTLLEGMPLVVLEAMACGLPVIVTANGPGDLVRDGIDGFVVPVRDPEAIAERLNRLYSDAELRHQMGRNARDRARQFGWEKYALEAENYLTELVNA